MSALNRVSYVIEAPGVEELVAAEEALRDGTCLSVPLRFLVRTAGGAEEEVIITCTSVELPPDLTIAYEMEASVNGLLEDEPVGCAFQVAGAGDIGSPL